MKQLPECRCVTCPDSSPPTWPASTLPGLFRPTLPTSSTTSSSSSSYPHRSCLFFFPRGQVLCRPLDSEKVLIAKRCVGVCLVGPLSVQTADSLGCSDPLVCCLCWPTPTPCSSFLRTRKRLALLTPSRGLALAGQEKRPPGWAGHRGGRAGREGEDRGGPASVR